MLKRVMWWSTGAAMGFGSSLWVQRKVRNTVQQLTPDAVQQRVQASARRIGPTVKAAVGEGRDAMRAREQELEAEVNGRTGRSNGREGGRRVSNTPGGAARRPG